MNAYNPHDKYKCPAPEEIQTDIEYTFSINPKDDFQYFDSENSLQRYQNFHKKAITYLLNYIAPTCDYYLKIELSRMGRLHMHGTIKIKDVFGFYCDSIIKLQKYGTYEIDTISEKKEWGEYMDKGLDYMGNRPRILTSKIAKEILTTPKFFVEEIKTKEHVPKEKGSRGRPRMTISLMEP